MRVFLSYAECDDGLARQVADALRDAGLDVWLAESEIMPGDNWAEKLAEALSHSDAMVVLLTHEALQSTWVRREIEYALGSKAYSRRLVPVLVGSPEALPEESVPWILRRLKMIRLREPCAGSQGMQDIAETLLATS